jgi:hypothetical protein
MNQAASPITGDPQAAGGLKVFEIGLWSRVGAILAGLAASMLFRNSQAMLVMIVVAMWALQLLATIVMTVGLGISLGLRGRGRPPLLVAFALHLVAVVAFAAVAIYVPQMMHQGSEHVAKVLRALDLIHYGAAILGAAAVLIAISRGTRDAGQEMFADRATGTIKLVLGLGVLMLGFWWWTRNPVTIGGLYAATLGLRVAAMIVIALYLGVIRQGRRLVADPDPPIASVPEPSW